MAGYAQISADSDGRLLVASMKGLAIKDEAGWSLLNANNGLPVSGVSGAWTDREGALWIALTGAGLVRLPGYSEWTSFSQPDGLSGDVVNGLAQSADGRIWVATSAGLSVASRIGREWKWRTVAVPGMDVVNNLSQAWDGTMLVTGNSPVVMRLNPSTGQWTGYGRVVGAAYSALLDRKGRVWVSTDRGLFRSNGKDLVLARLDGEIPPVKPPAKNEKPPTVTFIGAALGNGEDDLWISTYNGLLHYLDGRWRWLTEKEGIRSRALNPPAVDPQGRVWVGHRDVGGASLVEFKGGGYTVRTVDGAKGLGEELMYTFHFPRTGGAWALTSNGVQVFKDKGWIRLDRSDGLLWDECSQGAFLSAWDGSYWIGTSRGVSRFAPRAELRATPPPMAQITEARWGKTLVEPEQGKKLQVDGRTVQLRFAALGFRHAASNRFRYRVDNRDWVETTERTLNLEHLAAGPHTVEVKAGNVESGWNETAEVVEFEVAASWHELWWVRLLILLASLAMVMVVWRLRNRRLESARKALERAVEVRTEQLRLEKQKVVEQHAQIGQLLEKALEASRLKSEFLANMSHEIRTPMNAILGLMSLTLDSDLDEKQREQLDGARSAAVSLLGVLTDILDLSKIEAGRFEISPAPFDLHALLSSVHTLFSHEAEAKGLEMEVQIGVDVPAWVEGDKDRLRQVLVNLMSNAVKFTDKGKVSLQARAMPARGGQQEISVVVEDTGIGIAEQHREMVFEGFRQADGSITRRYGGTGLGLAITRKILHAMGGRIEMVSELGRGTRFTVVVRLPVVVREASGEKHGLRGEPAGERLRILVAEDNILNQKVAQRVLASTGLLALDAMTRQEFDVVVMDLQMPEMDGIEATRRMRSGSPRTSCVPVLGFTASALPEDRDACMAAGMNGLVNKPVEPRLFVSEVERLGAESRRKPGTPNE
jgi:signal transduction histidine kinase/CheY-like chemotaxis protein